MVVITAQQIRQALFTASFVTMAALPLWADEAMTWQFCLKEARTNNPQLLSARYKVSEAKADKNITRSGLLPQVAVSAGAAQSKVQGRDSTRSYDYALAGRQLLFDGFKSSHDLAVSRQRVEAVSYDQLVVSSNIRLNLRTAFVELLAAQESLKVNEDILKRRQQNQDLITLRYQAGLEHKGSLLTAQANTAQARSDLKQAQRNVELYQRQLVRQLGRPAYLPITAQGDLAVTEVDTAKPDFEALLEGSPLLKELTAQKEAARFGLKSARSALMPQVYADSSAGKTGSDWPARTGSWMFGLSVSWPLFQGGQQQAQIDKARAAYDQARSDERSGRDGVLLTLAQTWIQWQNDVEQVDVQDKFLEASQVRARISEAQYSSGLLSFNDWASIEDDLVRYMKAGLLAKAAALISEASWLQAKGETLDD